MLYNKTIVDDIGMILSTIYAIFRELSVQTWNF